MGDDDDTDPTDIPIVHELRELCARAYEAGEVLGRRLELQSQGERLRLLLDTDTKAMHTEACDMTLEQWRTARRALFARIEQERARVQALARAHPSRDGEFNRRLTLFARELAEREAVRERLERQPPGWGTRLGESVIAGWRHWQRARVVPTPTERWLEQEPEDPA